MQFISLLTLWFFFILIISSFASEKDLSLKPEVSLLSMNPPDFLALSKHTSSVLEQKRSEIPLVKDREVQIASYSPGLLSRCISTGQMSRSPQTLSPQDKRKILILTSSRPEHHLLSRELSIGYPLDLPPRPPARLGMRKEERPPVGPVLNQPDSPPKSPTTQRPQSDPPE